MLHGLVQVERVCQELTLSDEEPSAETIALTAQLQRHIASTASDDQTRSAASHDPR